MKNLFIFLLALFICFSGLAAIPVNAAGDEPLFLLGQNEKAEVMFAPAKVVSLDLGKNPIEVITGNNGQKLILCGGQEEKSGEITQGASLRLMAHDFQSYEKQIQCDSALTAFEVNKDTSIIWLATQGGKIKKEVIQPKIYRIDLNSLVTTEIILDSLPCQLSLSPDNKFLAVACLGENEKPSSVLTVFDADTSKQLASLEIAANPGMLNFSNDSNYIVVAGYGYPEAESPTTNPVKTFTVPTEFFKKFKKLIPAGINIIQLASLDNRQMNLGKINSEFVQGQSGIIYSIVQDQNRGIVRAIGSSGLLWEKKYDYIPTYVQEQPNTNEVFIMAGKKISIVDNTNGNTVKELSTDNDIQPFIFLDKSSYAYSYNMNKLKLNIMNLNNYEVEKALAAGSAGLAFFKAATVVLSMAAYADSLQPRYVNGVQMPTHVSPIYWVHTPKGNIVPSPDQKKLYMLNSFLAEIYTYDIQKEVVAKKLGYLGEKTLYLQMSPNGKYVILVAGDNWKLVNTLTDKADLTFSVGGGISFAFQEVTAPTPYFSPDGNTMYIPKDTKIMVIDLLNGKKQPLLTTKTKNAMIFW